MKALTSKNLYIYLAELFFPVHLQRNNSTSTICLLLAHPHKIDFKAHISCNIIDNCLHSTRIVYGALCISSTVMLHSWQAVSDGQSRHLRYYNSTFLTNLLWFLIKNECVVRFILGINGLNIKVLSIYIDFCMKAVLLYIHARTCINLSDLFLLPILLNWFEMHHLQICNLHTIELEINTVYCVFIHEDKTKNAPKATNFLTSNILLSL